MSFLVVHLLGNIKLYLSKEELNLYGEALRDMPGHLLPQSVLTLDDEGVLGVRTVEDGVVAFYPVTIVSDTREGVWVTGLPVISEVITVGQENVTAGQAVDASPTTEAAETTAS